LDILGLKGLGLCRWSKRDRWGSGLKFFLNRCFSVLMEFFCFGPEFSWKANGCSFSLFSVEEKQENRRIEVAQCNMCECISAVPDGTCYRLAGHPAMNCRAIVSQPSGLEKLRVRRTQPVVIPPKTRGNHEVSGGALSSQPSQRSDWVGLSGMTRSGAGGYFFYTIALISLN
jgi:hypothetical protein